MDAQTAKSASYGVDFKIPGFSSFEARPMTDGSISFNGTAKLRGACYFAMLKVTISEKGTPHIKIGDYRFETFTGKAVRGAANVELEDLMLTAKEVALQWAAKHYEAFVPG